jgi:poly(3-hydroxybutyrate) depolymerase
MRRRPLQTRLATPVPPARRARLAPRRAARPVRGMPGTPGPLDLFGLLSLFGLLALIGPQLVPFAAAQQELVVTIETTLADTTETFWLQIPAGYDPQAPRPLLIGWHQLGSDHLEFHNATTFDSIANARGWIAASPHGSTTTNWANHATQSHVVDVIAWIADHYAVDPDRIYMVGASMGGAAGMVFSNNHLDPDGPVIAAAASLSGIQDCERRFHEQGINNSMIAAFGGTPEQVPYEYHRNSAICFADSTESMHVNARHLPLWLTFGHGASDQIWREHAQDLYAALAGWADDVTLRESDLTGHGWNCAEEILICDFFEGRRAQRRPLTLSISADEEGAWGWTRLAMREPVGSFARFEARADTATAHLAFTFVRNVASLTGDLPAIGFPLDRPAIFCDWRIEDGPTAQLILAGIPAEPEVVLRDGAPYGHWYYDPLERRLALQGTGAADYAVLFSAAAVTPPGGGPDASPSAVGLRAWPVLARGIGYELASAGRLRWEIYDAGGRRVREGAVARAGRGRGLLECPTDLPGGVYLTVLTIADSSRPGARVKTVIIR